MGEVHLDARVGAECLEDDVAALALGRFFLGQLARLDQPLHQGLVLRKLHGPPLADQIGTAVAYLREKDMVRENGHRCGRRPHAADLGVRGRVGVDAVVRHLHRFAEPVGDPLRCRFRLATPRLHHVLVHCLSGHRARHLARSGAAHAVGHNEQRAPRTDLVVPHRRQQGRLAARQIGHEKTILVVVAGPAQIGLREDLDLDRFG